MTDVELLPMSLSRPRLLMKKAWQECIDTFGRSNVVIVSNASGTRDDPGGLEVC